MPCAQRWSCPTCEKEEQADLFAIMDEMDCTPSHAQAIKMRQMSEAKTGDERLAKDALVSIMKEEKPNQKNSSKSQKKKSAGFLRRGRPRRRSRTLLLRRWNSTASASAV